MRRLGVDVWVSCLLSSSECLHVGAISSLSPPAFVDGVCLSQNEGVLHLWAKVTNELKVLPDEGCAVEVLHTAGRHGFPELAMGVLRVLKTIDVGLREYHLAPIIEAVCRTNRIREALSNHFGTSEHHRTEC